MNNISGLLFRLADTAPHKTALIQDGRALDYALLAANVRKRVKLYRDKGLRDGDRVLVFVPMSIALYEILLALFHLGCTAVFLDSWADRERMDGALRAAGCRGFIGIPKSFLLLLRSLELRRVPVKLFASSTGAVEDTQGPGTEETALITFTTGSTGQPKAAKRTHGFLLEQHRVLTKEMALPPDSVDLATLPIFALNNLACGLTTIIPSFDMRRPGDVDGAKILAEAERYGATTVTASPAFLECLMRAITPGRVPTLRSVFTGGAAGPIFRSAYGRSSTASTSSDSPQWIRSGERESQMEWSLSFIRNGRSSRTYCPPIFSGKITMLRFSGTDMDTTSKSRKSRVSTIPPRIPQRVSIATHTAYRPSSSRVMRGS